MSNLEIHYAEEWAALYVDGRLDRVGDAYIAEQRVFELLGVRIVQDDAFMRGQDQSSGVAKTVEQVAEFRQQRQDRLAEAAQKRAEAKRLLDEAKQLEVGRP